LNLEIKNKQDERKNLELQIEQKNKQANYLDQEIIDATNIFNTQYSNFENLRTETDLLRIQLQNLKNFIKHTEYEDEYKNLEKKVEDIVAKIFDNKSINLPLLLVAVFEALRKDPTKYDLIFNYLESFKNDNVNEDLQSKEDYVFANNRNLLHEIDKITKKLFKVYSNKIISNII
jgi:hypothetical protein